MFELPNHKVLYEALVARDPSYEGRAYVGVSSTGVFCRLTCPARKPKSENCTFYDTVGRCIEAGFRPCKRCSPLGPAAETDASIQTLLVALEDDKERRWSEQDVMEMGFDPSTIRRLFKRHFGMTFLEMARQTRLRESFETLSAGGKVIDAQLDAGFSSPSAFRAAFAKLVGAAPSSFKKDALLKADWINTPLGPMVAVCDKSNLHLLEFVERKALPTELKKLKKSAKDDIGTGRFEPTEQIEEELTAFFDAKSDRFEVPLAMHGSDFTKGVWRELKKIPAGQTRSYGELAKQIGKPDAVRAVARANGANQIAIVIPCHRVVGADGALTGYGGGLWRKQKLIELEQKFARQK